MLDIMKAARVSSFTPCSEKDAAMGMVPYMHSGEAIPRRLAGMTPSHPGFFRPILAKAPWIYFLPNTETALPSTMPSAQ